MVTAAATLATLAREAAEDVFDGLTTDCTEPMRLERMTNMPANPPMTPVTLRPPTPPPPHAAADTAAAGAGERVAALLAENDNLSAEIDGWMRKAVAAEAERDRLSAELAAVRGAMPDAGFLDFVANRVEDPHAYPETAAKVRELSAALSATPTPPAAEAVTGGDDRPVKTHPVLDHRGREIGRRLDASEVRPVGPPLAALATPQEADHAAQ